MLTWTNFLIFLWKFLLKKIILLIQYWNICCIKFHNKTWLNCSIKKYLYFIVYFSYGTRPVRNYFISSKCREYFSNISCSIIFGKINVLISSLLYNLILNVLKNNSMGANSGKYAGRNVALHFNFSIYLSTFLALWTGQLSWSNRILFIL